MEMESHGASISQGLKRISRQQETRTELILSSKKMASSPKLDPLSSICKPLVIRELETSNYDACKKKLLSKHDFKNMTIEQILDSITLCEKLSDINKRDIQVLKNNIFNLKSETDHLCDLQAELKAVQTERRFALDKQRMGHYSTIENTMKSLQTLKDELQRIQTQIRRVQDDIKEVQGDSSTADTECSHCGSLLKVSSSSSSSASETGSSSISKQCCSGKDVRNEGGKEFLGSVSTLTEVPQAAGDTNAI